MIIKHTVKNTAAPLSIDEYIFNRTYVQDLFAVTVRNDLLENVKVDAPAKMFRIGWPKHIKFLFYQSFHPNLFLNCEFHSKRILIFFIILGKVTLPDSVLDLSLESAIAIQQNEILEVNFEWSFPHVDAKVFTLYAIIFLSLNSIHRILRKLL